MYLIWCKNIKNEDYIGLLVSVDFFKLFFIKYHFTGLLRVFQQLRKVLQTENMVFVKFIDSCL